MSHELRTPLTAIIGYAEILLEEAEAEADLAKVTDVENIQSSGRHLLRLIDDVLDLSKIEAGKMELFRERFEVAKMVEDVVATIQPMAERNSNRLELGLGDHLGAMYSDLTKVRQTLFNLLSNACKFTEDGTVELRVDRELADDGETIVFTVTDTGIGMSRDELGRVFDAFTQADSSTTRKFGGSGLGLAITRRVCRMLDGDISVESSDGEGSTFRVRLPVGEAGRKTPPVAPEIVERPSPVAAADASPPAQQAAIGKAS